MAIKLRRGKSRQQIKAAKANVKATGLKGKAKRQAIKKSVKPIRKARREQIVKKVKTSVGNAALAPLLPLKGTMARMLEKRGVSVPASIKMIDLATKFNNTFIKKGKGKASKYDDQDWHVEHPAFHTSLMEVSNFDEGAKNSIVGDVVNLVDTIVSYFVEKKKNVDDTIAEAEKEGVSIKQAAKKLGITITEEDAMAAGAMDKALDESQDGKPKDEPKEGEELDLTKIVLFAVGVILLVVVVKKLM